MAEGNFLKLGKNGQSIDLNKLKSGVTVDAFKDDAKALELFGASDKNKNGVLDLNEVTVFKDKLVESAGEDKVLSESETKKLLKDEEFVEQDKKSKLKSKDVFDFVNKYAKTSENSKVKSSVVEGDKRVVTYEDGAQEVINKDGSKIISTVSGAVKSVKNVDKDGNLTTEERTNDEDGSTESILFSDNKPAKSILTTSDSSVLIKTFDSQGNTTSAVLQDNKGTHEIGLNGFASGKIVKTVENKNTTEEKTIQYDYTNENSYTQTTSQGNVKSVTVVENNEFVSSVATQYDSENKPVQSLEIAKDGSKTETLYKDGRKVEASITNPDGKVRSAKYDGKGSTLVVAQNGETIDHMAKAFDTTKAEIIAGNKGAVHGSKDNAYFVAGQEVKIAGELSPNHKGLRGRKTSQQVQAQYSQDEAQRVAKRLNGKETKEVSVGKNYSDWYQYSREMLASEGVAKPSNEQVNDRANELRMMNPSVQVPKKGEKLTALKTQAEIKAEKLAEAKRQAEAQKAQQAQATQGAQQTNAPTQAQSTEAKQKAQQKATATKQGTAIATSLYKQMNSATWDSVSKPEFQAELKKINSGNVVETLRAYQKQSPDESMIEAIWDEKSSKAIFAKTDVRKEAINGITGKLLQRAKSAGVDSSHLANFKKEMSKYNNDKEGASEVMYGLMQAVENRESMSKADIQTAQSRTPHQQKVATVTLLNAQVRGARKDLQTQTDHDGWAGKTVDWMSGAWGSKNRESEVKKDLNIAQHQSNELARTKTDAEFKAKFKETYGVDFDPVQVAGFQKKSAQYTKAAANYSIESSFNSKMSHLLKGTQLRQESQYQAIPGAGNGQVVVTATKQQVYNRELNKFADFLGMGNSKAGMKQINDEMKKAGIDPQKATLDKKYEFLAKRAKSCSGLLHKQTMSATGGKKFSQVKSEYESSYTATFGTKNNIAKRVRDYNASQEAGAYALKQGVKTAGAVVIGIATGGTAVPLLAAAAGSTALSITVDATDRASSKDGLSAQEFKQIATNATIDGVTTVLSGGASKAIGGLGLGRATTYVARTVSDTAIDAGSEYIKTGKVTLENTIISAVSSLGGQYVQNKLEDRALAKALEMDESKLDDVNKGWLGQASDEHHRYTTTLSGDEVGNVPTKRAYVGRGMEVQSGETKGITYDVRMSQHNESIADVDNMLGKGASKTDFGEGLAKLEDRYKASGKAGSGIKGDNVKSWGTFKDNNKVKQMSLDKRLDVVQDAGNFSGMAYGDREINVNGWKQQSQVSANNGFHAKALEKDDIVMVVFRGSDDMGDLKADHHILSGKLPDQFQNAVDFMEQVRAANPDKKIVVTGHSLGGALTELVSSKYDDVLGISFDAVGTKQVVDATKGLTDNHNTINYIVNGDVISNGTGHVGNVTLVDNVTDVTRGHSVQSPHAIGNFMGTNNTSLQGVEAGMVQRTIDAGKEARAQAVAKGLTLDSAIARSNNGQVTFDDKTFKKIQKQFASDVEGLNVDLKAMQRQIDAVTEPSQKLALQKILDNRKVAITTGADIKANSTVLRNMSGDEINDILARDFGFDQPGFLGGDTPSQLIQMDKQTKFVRVYNDESSFAKGSWLMAYSDIEGLTPAQIKDKFALPAMPKYVVEVEVPAGAQMYTGKCNPLEGWGNGGGTQYFLIGEKRPKLYGGMKALPQQ